MKKISFLLLAFLMLFAFMPVNAAQGDTADLVLKYSQDTLSVGDCFTVDVRLENMAAKKFLTAEVALYYDTSVLNLENGLDSISISDELNNDMFNVQYSNVDEKKGLLWYTIAITPDAYTKDNSGLSVPSGALSLFSVKFKAVGKGETKLQVAKRNYAPDCFPALTEGELIFLDNIKEAADVSFPYNPTFVDTSGEGRLKGIRSITSIPDITVEKGTGLDTVMEQLPKTVEANLDDGTKIMIPITFTGSSMPAYDPDIASLYLFGGTLGDADGVVNDMKIRSFVKVNVVDSGTQPPVEPAPTEPPKPPVTFSDLDDVPWARDMILTLANEGIINGMGDGKFAPNDNVTRAEFVTMLTKAFDLFDETAESDFVDVSSGDWFYRQVSSAKEKGISVGYEDNKFLPNNEITRQEMAAMAFRTAEIANITLADGNAAVFSDDSEIAGYAKVSIYAMQKGGIISGLGDGSFGPLQNATRAQAAVIIYKLWNLK